MYSYVIRTRDKQNTNKKCVDCTDYKWWASYTSDKYSSSMYSFVEIECSGVQLDLDYFFILVFFRIGCVTCASLDFHTSLECILGSIASLLGRWINVNLCLTACASSSTGRYTTSRGPIRDWWWWRIGVILWESYSSLLSRIVSVTSIRV